jgi:hypothetical protein
MYTVLDFHGEGKYSSEQSKELLDYIQGSEFP